MDTANLLRHALAEMPKSPHSPPNLVRVIEVLAYPSVQMLDVTGPLQVFASANDLIAEAGGMPPYALRVVTQGHQGIDTGGATSRQVAGNQRNNQQNERYGSKRDCVGGAHAIEQRREQARGGQCGGEADSQSDAGKAQSKAENVPNNLCLRCAEGHTNTNVASALRHHVRQDSVDSD